MQKWAWILAPGFARRITGQIAGSGGDVALYVATNNILGLHTCTCQRKPIRMYITCHQSFQLRVPIILSGMYSLHYTVWSICTVHRSFWKPHVLSRNSCLNVLLHTFTDIDFVLALDCWARDLSSPARILRKEITFRYHLRF